MLKSWCPFGGSLASSGTTCVDEKLMLSVQILATGEGVVLLNGKKAQAEWCTDLCSFKYSSGKKKD
jgi:hypothetical protein